MSETVPESVKYKYNVEVNENVLFLVYLAHIYRFDIETLLLLYDRIGDDIFYIFFMFAGKSLVMPKHTKMVKIRSFVRRVMESLSEDEDMEEENRIPITYSTAQERGFHSFVKSLYDTDTKTISVGCELPVKDLENKLSDD